MRDPPFNPHRPDARPVECHHGIQTHIFANGNALAGTQVGAQYASEAAYVNPEILKAGKAQIEKFVAAEPRLKPYRHALDELVRQASHTLAEHLYKGSASQGGRGPQGSAGSNVKDAEIVDADAA